MLATKMMRWRGECGYTDKENHPIDSYFGWLVEKPVTEVMANWPDRILSASVDRPMSVVAALVGATVQLLVEGSCLTESYDFRGRFGIKRPHFPELRRGMVAGLTALASRGFQPLFCGTVVGKIFLFNGELGLRGLDFEARDKAFVCSRLESMASSKETLSFFAEGFRAGFAVFYGTCVWDEQATNFMRLVVHAKISKGQVMSELLSKFACSRAS